jgi:hypothetical protein
VPVPIRQSSLVEAPLPKTAAGETPKSTVEGALVSVPSTESSGAARFASPVRWMAVPPKVIVPFMSRLAGTFASE